MNSKARALLIISAVIVVGALATLYFSGISIQFPQKTTDTATEVSKSTDGTGSETSSSSYLPKPIDRSRLLSGKYTENQSPNHKFIARTFDNEQGDSGVYITTIDGKEVTATYCGYFREWSPDSKGIKVFVPHTCGRKVAENEFFELHTDGSISK